MPRLAVYLPWLFILGAQALHVAITGTSQGIGLDAAKRLIGDGHTVYHANRNSGRSAEAAQQAGGGIPMVCDLASLESVRAFADELATKPLDVLCLNAGIAPSTKAEAPDKTADGFEACVGTNHLGHFLLANLMAPKVNDKTKILIITMDIKLLATIIFFMRRRILLLRNRLLSFFVVTLTALHLSNGYVPNYPLGNSLEILDS